MPDAPPSPAFRSADMGDTRAGRFLLGSNHGSAQSPKPARYFLRISGSASGAFEATISWAFHSMRFCRSTARLPTKSDSVDVRLSQQKRPHSQRLLGSTGIASNAARPVISTTPSYPGPPAPRYPSLRPVSSWLTQKA